MPTMNISQSMHCENQYSDEYFSGKTKTIVILLQGVLLPPRKVVVHSDASIFLVLGVWKRSSKYNDRKIF